MLVFFLFACSFDQKPQSKASKRVDVQLQPELPGKVEVPLESLSQLIPASKDLGLEKQKRLWSLLHLINSPCEAESGSVLLSLKEGTCTGSAILQKRALRYLEKNDDELIDALTVPDSWFSHAEQGEEYVTVELWIEEEFAAQDQVLSRLKQIHDARLRICIRDSYQVKQDGLLLPVGQELSEISSLYSQNVNGEVRCSDQLSQHVRSSPTWFIDGFRLRGLQSVGSIQRLILLSQKDRK